MGRGEEEGTFCEVGRGRLGNVGRGGNAHNLWWGEIGMCECWAK